jgi:hypothetical protein
VHETTRQQLNLSWAANGSELTVSQQDLGYNIKVWRTAPACVHHRMRHFNEDDALSEQRAKREREGPVVDVEDVPVGAISLQPKFSS